MLLSLGDGILMWLRQRGRLGRLGASSGKARTPVARRVVTVSSRSITPLNYKKRSPRMILRVRWYRSGKTTTLINSNSSSSVMKRISLAVSGA